MAFFTKIFFMLTYFKARTFQDSTKDRNLPTDASELPCIIWLSISEHPYISTSACENKMHKEQDGVWENVL